MIRTICLTILAALAAFGHIAKAQETAKPPASMQEVLSSLRTETSPPEPMHFEAMMSGQSVGFASASLTPSTDGAGKGWEYHVEMIMKLPSGPKYVNDVKARLSPLFQPSSIELHREVIDPSKPKEIMIDKITIQEKEIELSHQAGDAEPTLTKAPRSEGAFVFAMEYFIPRVDFAKNSTFQIQELNPKKGSLIVHSFSATQRPDHSYLLIAQTNEGNPSYTFEFDAAGHVKSWSQQPVPLTFTRCSPDRIAEIKKTISNP